MLRQRPNLAPGGVLHSKLGNHLVPILKNLGHHSMWAGVNISLKNQHFFTDPENDPARDSSSICGSSTSPQLYHCTMRLSPLKSCIKEIKQNRILHSHFLELTLFQTKYFEIILFPVSLLIYIWVQIEY